MIEKQSSEKVTIVAHSLGGLVAAYLVATKAKWTKAHIASVVTFDSPLKGLPEAELRLFAAFLSTLDLPLFPDRCKLASSNPKLNRSLWDLVETSNVVKVINGKGKPQNNAAHIVPFYALDAILLPDVVSRARTSLEGSRPFYIGNWCGVNDFSDSCEPPKPIRDFHTSIVPTSHGIWDFRWDSGSLGIPRIDKGYLVGCAVLAGPDCTFLTPPASQEMEADSD